MSDDVSMYGYAAKTKELMVVLDHLHIMYGNFYITTNSHLYGASTVYISLVPIDDPDEPYEVFCEYRKDRKYKGDIAIPQEELESIMLLPDEAKMTYFFDVIERAYKAGIKELSKPRG